MLAASFAIACFVARYAPALAVALVASAIAMMLAAKARKTTRQILDMRSRELELGRKSTRAERRLMRASLRTALDQTELRSLFPALMSRVDADRQHCG